MVIREWRARALASQADTYPMHFREHVVPELQGTAGFLGAHLVRRCSGERLEFVVLTRWKSMAAVRDFAGPSPERAVVAPAVAAMVIDFDDTVTHYEVIEEVPGPVT